MAKKHPWEMNIMEESATGGKKIGKREAFHRKGFLKSGELKTAEETSWQGEMHGLHPISEATG